MSDNILFDTNILVYAYDESEKEKRQIAEKLVEDVFLGNINGILSNQILSELFYVLTEKINKPLKKEIAAAIIRKYILSSKWHMVNYTSVTVLRAALSASQHNNSFWDTLISETMKENGIVQIITENEKDFKNIPGIRVRNPFK